MNQTPKSESGYVSNIETVGALAPDERADDGRKCPVTAVSSTSVAIALPINSSRTLYLLLTFPSINKGVP